MPHAPYLVQCRLTGSSCVEASYVRVGLQVRKGSGQQVERSIMGRVTMNMVHATM
jgi:hypothetical protein